MSAFCSAFGPPHCLEAHTYIGKRFLRQRYDFCIVSGRCITEERSEPNAGLFFCATRLDAIKTIPPNKNHSNILEGEKSSCMGSVWGK